MRTLVLSLLLVGPVWAAEELALVPDTVASGNRYLVLVETSMDMKRQQLVARETVWRLLLNGFNGRIRANDTVALWTFSNTVETNRIPARPWVPAQRMDVANQAFRILQDVKLAKSPNMVEAVEAMKDEVVKPGILTVILVSSGAAPLEGTPMDRLVSDITGRNHEAMQEAGKPFVIALVTKDGKFLDYAVTPGGRPVFIPPLPKPPAPKPAATNQVNASVTATNKPKPMSVSEIEEALRQKAKPTNVSPAPLIWINPARSNAPAVTPPTERAAEPTVSTPATNAAPSVPISPAVASPAVPPKAEPPLAAPAAPVTNLPPATAPLTVPSPPVQLQPAPPPTTPADAPAPIAPRDRAVDQTPAATAAPPTTPPLTAVASAPPRRPPPSAAVPPPLASASSWTDLATGGALLVAAVALGWVLFRNLRSRPGASLISQSLDQDQK
jgi:hypothetical protein